MTAARISTRYARGRVAVAKANHDRWLVSYADFLTLLFAFFVVLFASSRVDKQGAERLSEAVMRAFNSTDDTLASSYRQLSEGLRADIRSGKVHLSLETRGLVVSLSQAGFFPSGGDAVDPSGYHSLQTVANAIRPLRSAIRLEGHTDNIPIHTGRFHSNWELSAARAIAVMELLRDRWQIAPDRLAISGYGDTVPVDGNATEAGRARNRRVDLVVLR